MRMVTGLYVYPVKSLRGIAVAESELDQRGLSDDRAFMIVDPDGAFVTQRELPALATIGTRLQPAGLTLVAEGLEPLALPREKWYVGTNLTVRVWNDACIAVDQGEAAARWLKSALGRELRLVAMSPSTRRPTRRLDSPADVTVGFADGYPLLVISEESLADLNGRMAAPLPMDRFRPNIVVAGCDRPFEEDEWYTFTIAAVTFRGVKRCARCVITTTDQRTGERPSKEPLATLATYRRFGREVLFGMNANHLGTGVLRIGDAVEVKKFELPPP